MADEIDRIRERWAAIDHVDRPRQGSVFEPGRSYVTWWTTDPSDGGAAEGVEARAWDPAMLDLARDTPGHVRTLLAEIDRLRSVEAAANGMRWAIAALGVCLFHEDADRGTEDERTRKAEREEAEREVERSVDAYDKARQSIEVKP